MIKGIRGVRMKSKLKIFLLLSVAFYFGIELLNPFKEEVVDLKKFTDYYEETNEENGGVSVLADSFYTFEKEYNFPNEYKSLEEIKGTENGKAETTEVVEEGIVVEDTKSEKKLPEKREYIVKEGDTISEIASLKWNDNGYVTCKQSRYLCKKFEDRTKINNCIRKWSFL